MNNEFLAEISIFDNFQVRKIFYCEERYFPVQDIVFVLTESKNTTDYIKKMRVMDLELSKGWGQIVTPLWINTS